MLFGFSIKPGGLKFWFFVIITNSVKQHYEKSEIRENHDLKGQFSIRSSVTPKVKKGK